MTERVTSTGTDRYAVEQLLSRNSVFGRLDDQTRGRLVDDLEVRTVAAGEVIIRQGDPADGLYLVAGGRVQIVRTESDGTRRVVSEAGYGELIGEMALVTDRPRSADAVALRDSHLLFLPLASYERVIAEQPATARRVTSTLVEKLAGGEAAASAVRSIVIVPLDHPDDAVEMARDLSETLERIVESHRVVTQSDAHSELGSHPTNLARASWCSHQERAHELVVYVAHPSLDAWTTACVAQADTLVLLADASADPSLRELEGALRRRARTARTELVLLHAASTVNPRRTDRWLDCRDLDRHHHVRRGDVGHAGRVARLLLNRGVGVVFSGGGARGIAHIGVYRSLLDHGIPIDAAGGTSIGSIIAGAVAREDPPAQLEQNMRDTVAGSRSPIDVTLPAVSLATGRRVTESIKEAAAGLDLEDLWRPYFCVSTNLTAAAPEVHRRGPGWKAIRASFAIPGVFPPVLGPTGDVLVDGGLVENMPVGTMRRTHDGVTVIASDVSATREHFTADLPESGFVSGWRYLGNQIRKGTYSNLAGLPRVLVRLTALSANESGDNGDCHLRLGTDAVGMLDFKAFDQLVEIGYRDTSTAIECWLDTSDRRRF